MTVQVFHIEVDEESDFEQVFVYRNESTGLPVNISTGYEAEVQVRKFYDGVDLPEVELAYSTDAGEGIVLGADGTITWTILPADTTDLLWKTGVYDLFLTNTVTGKRFKFARGFFTVLGSVSKLLDTTIA